VNPCNSSLLVIQTPVTKTINLACGEKSKPHYVDDFEDLFEQLQPAIQFTDYQEFSEIFQSLAKT